MDTNFVLFKIFQGEDNVEYYLGLTPSGIILLRNKTKVGNYYWPRINKIYYKVQASPFIILLELWYCFG